MTEQEANVKQQGDQLFIVDPKVMDAFSYDEVIATVNALEELNLYKLPYEKVTVRFPSDKVFKKTFSDEGIKEFAEEVGEEAAQRFVKNMSKTHVDITISDSTLLDARCYGPRFPRGFYNIFNNGEAAVGITREQLHEWAKNVIVTIFATRNIVKSTKHVKRAKLGIGPRTHEYVTTISLPKDIEIEIDREHIPLPGNAVRPHLRRGHLRNQHYGPRNLFTKRIWIEPVIVNADENFVNKRKAYNLSSGTLH